MRVWKGGLLADDGQVRCSGALADRPAALASSKFRLSFYFSKPGRADLSHEPLLIGTETVDVCGMSRYSPVSQRVEMYTKAY